MKIRLFLLLIVLIGLMLISLSLAHAQKANFPNAPATGITSRVSVASDGTQGNGSSSSPVISADGRFVVFHSDANNLVFGDTNGLDDVFVHDRQTGETMLVSVSSDGTQGSGGFGHPYISADGRYVAFHAWASNLISGDTNGASDVFVHDRETGETTRVSVASDGTEGNSNSYYPYISSDGRYVTFVSFASNLVSDDTNGIHDVFVHDRLTGQTSRVSVSSDGTQGNNTSLSPAISGDGRYVAFVSDASNLVIGDNNDLPDIFIHDRLTGQTKRASIVTDGHPGNNSFQSASLSADGRFVALATWAPMVGGDTNNDYDIFVYDQLTEETTRVSIASDGTEGNGMSYIPHISPDGRYVAFGSWANNLVSNDTNGVQDTFIHDRETGQTERVSVASDGMQANNNGALHLSTSADGRYITFDSDADNLVSSDTNGVWDIFVHDRGTGSGMFSISGQVTDGNSNPIEDVTLSTASISATTDASGNYTITGLITGTYTVTPSKPGYSFTPPSLIVQVPPDSSGQDFVGTTDSIPPASITNLSATSGLGSGQVNLTWTAPGDDGNSGTASSYLVRYADIAITTEFGWILATEVNGEPTPLPAGTEQGMVISGLTPGQTYYFAIKTQDEVGNTSDLSNSPAGQAALAPDIGFRPNPDGYGFNNPGGAFQPISCNNFKEIFSGEPIICRDGKPQQNYLEYYQETAKSFNTGICVGMSTTSLDYFIDGLPKPEPIETYQLSLEQSWNNIMLYHGRQLSQAYHVGTYNEWQKWGPGADTSTLVDDVYQQLQHMLQPGFSDPVTILFWPKPPYTSDIVGHAITPYQIDDVDPLNPKVYVYENFGQGDSNKFIQFNLTGNNHTFSYVSHLGRTWNSSNRAMVLAPLSIWHDIDATKLFTGSIGVKSGGGELVISNDEDKIIGFVSGVLTATLPGALPVFPWATSEETQTNDLSYMLPDGSYTATIMGATTPYTYTIWTTKTLIQVKTGADPVQEQSVFSGSAPDHIRTNATGDEIILQSGNNPPQSYTFSLMNSQFDESITYGVENVSLDQNTSMVVGMGDNTELYLNNGSQSTNYDLKLQLVTTDTMTTFIHSGISISATDIHTITVGNWEQMSFISLKIDHGGDGTVDETVILWNELNKIYLPVIQISPSYNIQIPSSSK